MKTRKIYASGVALLAFILFCFGYANIGALQTLLPDNKLAKEAICSSIVDGLIFCADTREINIGSGEEVSLNFFIRNFSSKDILVDTSSGLSKYNIAITDGNGSKVRTKVETKRLANTEMSENDRKEFVSSIWINHHSEILEPDNCLEEKLTLSRTYDFSIPGRYFVEISRKTKNPRDPQGNGFIELPLPKIEIVVK